MKTYVIASLVLNVLAFVLTTAGLARRSDWAAAMSALLLSGWIAWAAVLLFR